MRQARAVMLLFPLAVFMAAVSASAQTALEPREVAHADLHHVASTELSIGGRSNNAPIPQPALAIKIEPSRQTCCGSNARMRFASSGPAGIKPFRACKRIRTSSPKGHPLSERPNVAQDQRCAVMSSDGAWEAGGARAC